jgi:ABC-2 type transport system permease protein
MQHSIWWRTLWDRRRGLFFWQLGFLFIPMVYGIFYPSIRNPEMQAALLNYPPAIIEAFGMEDMFSPAGYLQSSVFGIVGPFVLIVYAATLGARLIAGDEERGYLELLLSAPVGRTAFYLQRAAALLVMMLLSGVMIFLSVIIINRPAELNIAAEYIAAMAVHFTLLGLLLSSVSFAVGAISGRSVISVAASSIVGIGGYLANTLAPQVAGLEGLQQLSPFSYYLGGSPLKNGVQGPDALVLAGVALLLIGAAWPVFQRRDIGVG